MCSRQEIMVAWGWKKKSGSGLKKYFDIMVNLVGSKAIHEIGNMRGGTGLCRGARVSGESMGIVLSTVRQSSIARFTMQMSCQRVLGWRESIQETTIYD